MSKLVHRCTALIIAPAAVLALISGCNTTEVPLEKAPPVAIPAAVPVDKQPKAARPAKGSSGGMNYDPSGMSGGPPQNIPK
jgi:hypothetical protein